MSALNEVYANVSDTVSSVVLAKEIATEAAEAVVAEEDRRRKTATIVLVSLGIAGAAIAIATAVFLATKNKDGERRGKVLYMKIKSKLPCKKKKENCCEVLADDDCDF